MLAMACLSFCAAATVTEAFSFKGHPSRAALRGRLAGPGLATRSMRLQQRRAAQVQTEADEDVLASSLKRSGPEAPAEYWENSDNIMRELEVFFMVREEEEQKLMLEKEANPLKRFMGISDGEYKRIVKRRGTLLDRDLYSDLRRYGFEYLILPIMEQGGWRNFAEMLGSNDEPPRQEDKGGLALGLALEEKLESLSNAVSADPPQLEELVRSSMPSRLKMDGGMRYDSPEELNPENWKKAGKPAPGVVTSTDGQRDWLEELQLSNVQKLYTALLWVILAVGFGKATEGAIGRGVLSQSTAESVRIVAQAMLVANVFSAPLAGILMVKAGEPLGSVLPAVVKALLSGPVVLWEIRTRGMSRKEG